MKKRALARMRDITSKLHKELQKVQDKYNKMERASKKQIAMGITSLMALAVGSYAVYKMMKIRKEYILKKAKKWL